MYLRVYKPAFDFISSVILTIILVPFYLVLILILFFTQGRPVFFIQTRPGYGGRLFKLYKFRTMTDIHDALGNLLPDELRITRLGHFLRRTSFDELPQFINVLKGDLSIVGPRPLLPEYMGLYSDEQKRRHAVKPGLTGLAQINGRNAISWEEKFKLDLFYVDNISFKLDIWIIYKTLISTLKDTIVNSKDDDVIMKKFTGNE